MGKLLILILALVLVLVILPGDVKNWCVMQFNTLMAGAFDFGNGTAVANLTSHMGQIFQGV
jgi:hypothetical protein